MFNKTRRVDVSGRLSNRLWWQTFATRIASVLVFFAVFQMATPAYADLVSIERALDRVETRVNFFSSQGIVCTSETKVNFENCKDVAAAIAQLRALSAELARLRQPIETEKELTNKAASEYLHSLSISQEYIEKIDDALIWQDFITAVSKAVLLSGDLTLIKRRWSTEGKFERNLTDPFGNKPNPGLDDIEWNISDAEASALTKAVNGLSAVASGLRDEQGILDLSMDPGSKDDQTLTNLGTAFDAVELTFAANDLRKAIATHGIKEVSKHPGPRGALLLFVEKAGDYIIKWDKMKRLARRKSLITTQGAEQLTFDDFISRMRYMQDLIDRTNRLERDLNSAIRTLEVCFKSMCPDLAIPGPPMTSPPSGSFSEQQKELAKRIETINDELADLADGSRVTRLELPPVPGSTAEEKAEVARLNAELTKLREKMKTLEEAGKKAFDRLVNDKSDDVAADKALRRGLRDQIKELKKREAEIEQKRDEASGKKAIKQISVKMSTEMPATCKAGETCVARARVTNEGGDLYSVAMPVVFSVSAYLPGALHEGDGWVCAAAGKKVLCLTDGLDLRTGDSFDVSVPLMLPASSSRRLETCGGFADLGGLRDGNLSEDGARLVQLALTGLGIELGKVDGKIGAATLRAAGKFADVVGLDGSDRISGELVNALLPLPMFAAPTGKAGPQACVTTKVMVPENTVGKPVSTSSKRTGKNVQKVQRKSGSDPGEIFWDALDTYGQMQGSRKRQKKERRSSGGVYSGQGKPMVRSPPPELVIPAN